ncbi:MULTISPECIES: cytochrome b [unclassified Pseudomonas]|uniref:cytochrome b n=1 Tax=unclassified Pseudomonas TaxID=196821 RepID=UPI000BD9499F|nr:MULTISPECIES: cytochrome b/b6 domain-containing protein [unclassified Pseudomonas]PVZ19837.1 cytochrome b561 [Pseudomonas sp. URIL14HWK12:I12]PVZ26903.1 cytochrome b561 [Pseudomonas sp. URIL14HWK12:I10]PVZ37792.1 cytochrome b561 [Pseudomonas sp. URIL14HWK12:I11]SNZ05650.1 cytochrome b561 [Pseudomonas sp. URIL14HWK12:I9]
MPPRYSPLRRALHWLSALMILWATLSGFGALALAADAPLRLWVEQFNPQVTSVFIPFFAWRCVLRWKAAATDDSERVAHVVHLALYGVTGAVLITGVLMMSHPVRMFSLFTLPELIHDSAWLARLHQWHHAACMALAALVSLHVLAVAWHHLNGRRVLARML